MVLFNLLVVWSLGVDLSFYRGVLDVIFLDEGVTNRYKMLGFQKDDLRAI